MDLSKLSPNQKLALYGAIAVFLAGLISNWGGVLWLSILAAIGAAVVVFLPQVSPNTSLPGSRGSLLAVLGFVALAGALIELLRYLNYTFNSLDEFSTWMFLIALVGSAVMAWGGWQELQREGGKWVLGGSSSSGPTAGTTPAAAPPAETDPAASVAQAAATEPSTAPPAAAPDAGTEGGARPEPEDRFGA